MFPLFIIAMFIYKKDVLKKINFDFLMPMLLSVAISLPNFFQALNFQITTNWISKDTQGFQSGNNWSIENLLNNSLDYGMELFNSAYFPFTLTLLAIAGFLFLFFKKRRTWIFLTSWFVLIWLIYFTSWFQTLGGKDRFYLSFYLRSMRSLAVKKLGCGPTLGN